LFLALSHARHAALLPNCTPTNYEPPDLLIPRASFRPHPYPEVITMKKIATCALVLGIFALLASGDALAGTVLQVNLKTSDIGYSTFNGLFYAAVPNASAVNPNTLTPIDPTSGALGTAIPIGFDPTRVAVSSDGANLFAVIGDKRGVQRYNLPTASADQLFTIAGGPQIGDFFTVPGRPNAVFFHLSVNNISPPAHSTVVYENGVKLPNQVGNGVGVGGPDAVSIDPTDGTRAYGYQNTISSWDHVPMALNANGVQTAGPSNLAGVITGAVDRLELIGDRIFTSQGKIYSLSLGIQIGAFDGGQSFVFDPAGNKFFSVTSAGNNKTIHAYALDTLLPLGTETYGNITGTVGSVRRFGVDGLAFRTSTDRVVFINSALVPEPSSAVLAGVALVGMIGYGWRRQRSSKTCAS
jgi:hypothetical protein